jgi:hypothetical protein
VKTVIARDPFEGGRNLINTYGFGPLVPNTILIGETEDKTRFVEYARFIIQAAKRQRNLVIVREGLAPSGPETDERIDVWWRGKGSNAGFMLALSHLIRKSPDWKNARLMINMVFQSDKEREGVEKHLDAFLQSSRLNAGYRLIRSTSGNPLQTIRESSGDARLVLIGLRAPEPDENAETYSGYYEGLLKGTEGLPTTALVLASESVDFHGIFK